MLFQCLVQCVIGFCVFDGYKCSDCLFFDFIWVIDNCCFGYEIVIDECVFDFDCIQVMVRYVDYVIDVIYDLVVVVIIFLCVVFC